MIPGRIRIISIHRLRYGAYKHAYISSDFWRYAV